MTNKRILAVDDTAINLRIIKKALEKSFEVRIAKSGNLALEIIKTEKIDLILLDIEMPEMSGFEFVQDLKIRQSKGEGTSETIPPVIFVTAHATPELLSQAESAGGIGYVIKPFDPDILYDKVVQVLETAETHTMTGR